MAASHQADQVVLSYRRALLGAHAANALSADLKEHDRLQAGTTLPDHPSKATCTNGGSNNSRLDIDEHLLTLPNLFAKLHTSVDLAQPTKSYGLSSATIPSLQLQHGKNILTPPKPKPIHLKFIECLANLFNMILAIAGIGHIILYLVDPFDNESNGYIGGVLVGVSFVNAAVEVYELQKIASILNSFVQMIPQRCTAYRNGKSEQILASELVPGDVIFVKLGDKVPADSVVFHATELQIDISSWTGEADPAARAPYNPLSNIPLDADALRAVNVILNGSLVVGGEGFAVVVRTGDKTALGRIASSTRKEKKRRSPLSHEIRRFCKTISFLASATAFIFFIASLTRGRDINYSLHFGIGILIAWIPQGLPVTVTMLLTIAGHRMKNRNVLVKDLHGVETLGAITLLATDKTGTLTKNKMTVIHVWTGLHFWSCVGKESKDEHQEEQDHDLRAKDLRVDASGVLPMLMAAATCTRARFANPGDSDAVASSSTSSGDATDAGLLRFAATRLANIDALSDLYPKVFEIPFMSETGVHMTIHRKGHREGQLTVYCKGAPEKVLSICSTILIDNQNAPLNEDHKRLFYLAYEGMAKRGHRVIAFAQMLLSGAKYPENYRFALDKKNWPTSGLTFLGLVSLDDPPKHGVRQAIGKLRNAGIKVMMITGDHPLTAEAVARRLNIITGQTREAIAIKERVSNPANIPKDEYTARVVKGDDINKLTESEWHDVLTTEEVVFARTSPKHKLEIVTKAQALGHIVGVTGDGVNDAAALKKADLGIAMNKTGSDVSKEAAGMILLDDDFATIVAGVLEGRVIFVNLKKCIQYTLTHIMPEVLPYLLFVLVPMPLAITAVQILVVDLGFEIFTTLSFAWEPAEEADLLMKQPPRRPVRITRFQEQSAPGPTPNAPTAEHGGASSSHNHDGQLYVDIPMDKGLTGTDDDEDDDDDEISPGIEKTRRTLDTRWRRYGHELTQITRKHYWTTWVSEWRAMLFTPAGERLVDAEVLSWSYLEAGLIEFAGAFVTFFVIMGSFGVDPSILRMAQQAKKYFKPSAPDLVLSDGSFMGADAQIETLRQAQSGFYLSILTIQIWNLFACKARLRLPFGRFVLENKRTWLSICAGSGLGFVIVYLPFLNGLFLTSASTSPIFLLIPMCFGALLIVYATIRRLLLRVTNPDKWAAQNEHMDLMPSMPSLDAVHR
ncbi:hypothetical protein SeMB42_g07063 [Synchytrium endobioticum]|uniref:Cation-transporting P-type ATPase N-terminal domain-containing protein n=1 Tax=Synchytrium endobioticum TaxID=286115 RepID=A0A507CAG0_9FUNG|nr:hypothetical protein SeMB42_g07063 [Synchytrium endobioticum]